jgi:hypothetical protein
MTEFNTADEIDAEVTRLLKLKSERWPDKAISLLESYRQRALLTGKEVEAVAWAVSILTTNVEKYVISARYRSMRKTLEELLRRQK